ncbi:hypothetical protein Syun_020940 [Stephania yunnanensis]|uniref:Cation/H+ exchanger transmembrane domain-containing protein n=1 Tax=Stephania yunnanensis TaxID=152371 RepID=A0AAP0NPB8_9MAGN
MQYYDFVFFIEFDDVGWTRQGGAQLYNKATGNGTDTICKEPTMPVVVQKLENEMERRFQMLDWNEIHIGGFEGSAGIRRNNGPRLELELNEAGTRLGDPPSSVDELLGILDGLMDRILQRSFLIHLQLDKMENVFFTNSGSEANDSQVLKFMVDRNSNNSLHGQVTIGTLIFQDCAVGILFALLPVLGGNSGLHQGIISMGKLLLVLSIFLICCIHIVLVLCSSLRKTDDSAIVSSE